jgi:parallel beta-helix repeat protein
MNKYIICIFALFVSISAPGAVEKSGTISASETWTLDESPYHIRGTVNIPQGVAIQVEPGVEVLLERGVNIIVRGRFDALGTGEQPILFQSSGSQRWGVISYEFTGSGTLQHSLITRGSTASGERTGMVTAYQCTGAVIIEDCTFTDWPSTGLGPTATQACNSTQMEIRRCYFGPGQNEAVHAVGTPILVEHCLFDERRGYTDAIDCDFIQLPRPRAIIRYNVFLRGEDDCIDLDDCDAWVEGNLVMSRRGGDNDPIGISGDRDSHPILINNVIYDCESGIAFKNGAEITVINNTIVNCDRGFWMHQNPAHATVYNTIIWGRDDQTSIRLEPGSTIDISYSIIKGDTVYPGVGNSNADPMFVDPENLNFNLLPDSPAIDAGTTVEYVPLVDYERKERVDLPDRPNLGEGELNYVDIGAYEYQVPQSIINLWRQHVPGGGDDHPFIR